MDVRSLVNPEPASAPFSLRSEPGATPLPASQPIPITHHQAWTPYPSPSSEWPQFQQWTQNPGPFRGPGPPGPYGSFAAAPQQFGGYYAPQYYGQQRYGPPGLSQQQGHAAAITQAITRHPVKWFPPSPPLEGQRGPLSAVSGAGLSTDTLPSLSGDSMTSEDLASIRGSPLQPVRAGSSSSGSESEWGMPSVALDLLCETARMVEQQQPGRKVVKQNQPQQHHRSGTLKAGVPISSKHRCPQCGRAFRSSSHLSRHRKSVHSDRREFVCRYGCGACFNRGDNRNMHEKKCGAVNGN